MEDCSLPGLGEVSYGGTMGIHKIAIPGPEFLDGEIGSEQASIWAEDRNRFCDNIGDVCHIIAMNESP